MRRSTRERHRHAPRDAERLRRAPRKRARGEPLDRRRDPRRATRVVNSAHHQLGLQPRRKRLVGIPQLRHGTLEDIDRVHPPKQTRVRLGDLERELGTLPRIRDQSKRLLQVRTRHLAAGARRRARSLTQDAETLRKRWRLCQRTAQQARSGRRRAAAHRRPRSLLQAGQNPGIARWPHADEMRGDLPGRRPIGVEQPRRRTMSGVPLLASQRPLDQIANDWVNEARRIVGGQHLRTDKAGGQGYGLLDIHGRNRRRVPQLAAVPEHRKSLRKAKRARTEPTHPGQHPPRNPLAT